MNFGIPAFGVAALLVAAVAVMPLASSASAQMALPDNSFGFDDTMMAHNATGMSFLIVSGLSIVEGAEVTGVVMSGEDEISVTMTNENETEADAVMVMAFTGEMDMMSVLSSEYVASFMNDTSFGNSSVASTDDDNDDNSGPGSDDDRGLRSSDDDDDDSGEVDDSGRDSASDFDDFFTEDFSGDDSMAFGHPMNPLGLFENIKNGSSIVPQGWDSPQNVNVTLSGNATGATTSDPDTTFVFVMIVPNTEETTQTVEG